MPIEFKEVSFSYNPKAKKPKYALDKINLTLMDNEFIGVIGHTGSGKSTLIQQINALLIPSEGEVCVNDYVIKKDSKISGLKILRKTAGMVFQFSEYQLFEETIFKDIAFGPKNFGVKEEEFKDRCIELLKIVGLDESFIDRSPFELSGGQKRRVAIAGILALDPSILILDEPTAGLDPQGSKDMLNLLKRLHEEQGKTIILVTHDMHQVLKYCSKAVVMKNGQIVCYDEPINIFTNEELLKNIKIEMPYVTSLAFKLKNNGLNIDIHNCRDAKSLVSEIIRVKGTK